LLSNWMKLFTDSEVIGLSRRYQRLNRYKSMVYYRVTFVNFYVMIFAAGLIHLNYLIQQDF